MNLLHNNLKKSTFGHSFLVMLRFMHRDFLVCIRRFRDQIINLLFLYPICLATSGVVVSSIFFDSDQEIVFAATNMFAVAPMLPLLVLTYHLMFEIFYDLEGNRFINYQQIVLSPSLILLEKIIVGTLTSFCIIAPLYPVSYLFIFHRYVSLAQAHWAFAYLVLFAASFCLCAYNLCAAVILRRDTLNIFWNRINHCLLMSGGFIVPSSLLIEWWKPMKFILLCNPLHFFSESCRSSIVGGSDFFPYRQGIVILFALGSIFSIFAVYAFKKRVDHI